MLIRLFRSDFTFQFIILLILAVLLWLPALLNPLPAAAAWSPFGVYAVVVSVFNNLPFLRTLLAMLLVLTEGIFLTLLLTNHDLSPRNSAMPVIIYLIFMSWHPSMLTFHPAIFANAFLILFLYMFLNVYERPDAFKEVFSACFALSLSVFFDFSGVVFILLVWFGFLLYRVFSWREWAISLVGFCLPLLFAGFYYFWNDQFFIQIKRMTDFLFKINLIDLHFEPVTMIVVIIMALFTFSAILKVLGVIQEKVISIRKKFLFMIWFFILAIPVFFFSGEFTECESIIPVI
ncbi:MAG: hypothetical protein NTU44_03135 [Bacteroidetes bacterium]|nr:hypothetical protein [Bacteroidota bacterium]